VEKAIESEKKCSSKRFRKVNREGADVTSAGRASQTRAPATEKARRPTVGSLTAGTHRSSEVEDRRLKRRRHFPLT